MAYLRSKNVTIRGKTYGPYWELVETHRQKGGQPEQKVIKYFGKNKPSNYSETAPDVVPKNETGQDKSEPRTERFNNRTLTYQGNVGETEIWTEDGADQAVIDDIKTEYKDELKEGEVTKVRLLAGDATRDDAPDSPGSEASKTLAYYNSTSKGIVIFRADKPLTNQSKGAVYHELAHAKDDVILRQYGGKYQFDRSDRKYNVAYDAIHDKKGAARARELDERSTEKFNVEYKKKRDAEEERLRKARDKKVDSATNNTRLKESTKIEKIKKANDEYDDGQYKIQKQYSRENAKWEVMNKDIKESDPKLYHIMAFDREVKNYNAQVSFYQQTISIFEPDKLRSESFAEYRRIEKTGSDYERQQMKQSPAYPHYKAIEEG